MKSFSVCINSNAKLLKKYGKDIVCTHIFNYLATFSALFGALLVILYPRKHANMRFPTNRINKNQVI